MTNQVSKNVNAGKLVIGTASWGNNYGLANTTSVGSDEAGSILSLASSCGILALDTAPAYGDSELVLGQCTLEKFGVFTKVTANGSLPAISEFDKSLETSLTRLGVQNLRGITFHSVGNFLANHSQSASSASQAVDAGICKTWGVSVYEPEELLAVLECSNPDYIQAPVNLVDQRFLKPRITDAMQSKGVILQARSVYLQGLLLQDAQNVPARFAEWEKLLNTYRKVANDLGVTLQQLALRSVVGEQVVGAAVVGLNSEGQMRDLATSINLNFEVPKLGDLSSSTSKGLVDPRTWTA